MGHEAFQYEFTYRELFYFLFRKKVCPNCGGKLSKTKDYEIVEGYLLNNSHNAFFVPNAKVKCYRHIFLCSNCKVAYPITDLAK